MQVTATDIDPLDPWSIRYLTRSRGRQLEEKGRAWICN